MAMSANQLQAMFARRREMEHVRTERSAAVNRYYDHWGKVTSRFENWTNPEYYEQADAQLRKKKETAEKATRLEERREKLKKLFSEEQSSFEEELKGLQRCKPRSRQPVDIDTLEKIAQQNKERQDIKRKLELESRLYGRWRHNVEDEKLLYDSKSEHEALAKLNWLDKKVEEQMQREKEEAAEQERNLRLQEEKRKTEEALKERQQLRALEIKDIQALQEQHMEAIKQRHDESQELREEEKALRMHTRELAKEKELLEESSAYVREPPEISQAYNLKKIKVLIRQRAETFRNQLKLTVNILERMQPYAVQRTQIDELLQDYRKELEAEEHLLKKVDLMYESEAKHSLQLCEESWQAAHLKRYHEVKRLIEDEHYMFNARLKENTSRQKDIIELREKHIKAIEDANAQLNKLVEEQKPGDANESNESGKSKEVIVESLDKLQNNDGAGDRIAPTTPGYFGKTLQHTPRDSNSDNGSLPKTTSSFHNLNLDVWQDLPPARKGDETPRLESQRSLRVVTPETAERPRFARKRVAWM